MKTITARFPTTGLLLIAALLASGCAAVDDALDPNCTPEKAARNAATQAMVGLPSNRCTPGETARDLTGTDAAFEDAQDRLPGT